MMKALDTDGNGTIDFEEFLRGMSGEWEGASK